MAAMQVRRCAPRHGFGCAKRDGDVAVHRPFCRPQRPLDVLSQIREEPLRGQRRRLLLVDDAARGRFECSGQGRARVSHVAIEQRRYRRLRMARNHGLHERENRTLLLARPLQGSSDEE